MQLPRLDSVPHTSFQAKMRNRTTNLQELWGIDIQYSKTCSGCKNHPSLSGLAHQISAVLTWSAVLDRKFGNSLQL